MDEGEWGGGLVKLSPKIGQGLFWKDTHMCWGMEDALKNNFFHGSLFASFFLVELLYVPPCPSVFRFLSKNSCKKYSFFLSIKQYCCPTRYIYIFVCLSV